MKPASKRACSEPAANGMKRLMLVRHAKSSWSDARLADIDRPLSERGERDAPRMGERLRVRKARPSLILSSPAKRAKATAKVIARSIGYPEEFLQYERRVYSADYRTLLDIIAEQDDACSELMLVAHNPSLTVLANQLAPELDVDNVPTTGIVAIDFDVDHWADLAAVPGRVVYFDYPKNKETPVPADRTAAK